MGDVEAICKIARGVGLVSTLLFQMRRGSVKVAGEVDKGGHVRGTREEQSIVEVV